MITVEGTNPIVAVLGLVLVLLVCVLALRGARGAERRVSDAWLTDLMANAIVTSPHVPQGEALIVGSAYSAMIYQGMTINPADAFRITGI